MSPLWWVGGGSHLHKSVASLRMDCPSSLSFVLMAEINSEVGGFSHSVGKSRKGKKVLGWEHHNLIVPVAEVFFLLKNKNMYWASCTMKKERPCSDNREELSTVDSILWFSCWEIFLFYIKRMQRCVPSINLKKHLSITCYDTWLLLCRHT